MSSRQTIKRARRVSNSDIINALSVIVKFATRNSKLLQADIGNLFSNHTTTNNGDLYSAKEAAAYLGLTPKTLANWRVAGVVDLPYIRIGSRVFYQRADLVCFISSRKRTSTSFLRGTEI